MVQRAEDHRLAGYGSSGMLSGWGGGVFVGVVAGGAIGFPNCASKNTDSNRTWRPR